MSGQQCAHCCQLEEIGGFEEYEEDALGVAEDEWFEKYKGRDEESDLPDNLKVTADHLATAIGRDLGYDISYFATTAPDQTLATAALRLLGFKRVAFFPGTSNREIALWLKPRATVTKKKKGETTHGRRTRKGTKCKSTCKRA